MRNIYKAAVTAIICMGLLSCADDSATLLDQAETYATTNPETAKILKDRILDAKVFPDGKLVVTTVFNVFYSNNGFKTLLSLESGKVSAFVNNVFFGAAQNPTIASFYGSNIEFRSVDEQGNLLQFSEKKCDCWKYYYPSVEKPGIVRDIAFLGPRKGWVLNNTDEGELVLEQFDGEKLIPHITINGSMEGRIEFFDENKGLLLFSKTSCNLEGDCESSYFSMITTDGGASWSEPKYAYEAVIIVNMEFISATEIYFEDLNNNFYLSRDSGQTWEKIVAPNGHRILDVVPAGYALLVGQAKFWWMDIDSGEISALPQPPIVNSEGISFHTKDNGIVYDEYHLYLTEDGGLNWTTLIYPYPYLLP